ncbi:MAG: translation elongation factor 4 [Planctomycetota bacterium]|jgi:GTP-binding protein LepA|nr:translation elongation factor 4 [Planctomycetota bacterium]
MNRDCIRNFSIIAHIDHGKSTLADRFLDITRTVAKRDQKKQQLDDMDLERERGITIKAKAASMDYIKDGKKYRLNLIDTPGHVDFNYEVERALAACEGALLLVDASQGVEAQTVHNTMLAEQADLMIFPVINKIDLATARSDEVIEEIENALAIEGERSMKVSAKTGEGVRELLDAIVDRVPPPEGLQDAPLRALIYDAEFNDYRGVILHIRIVDGALTAGARIRLFEGNTRHEALEIGIFRPALTPVKSLSTGEVGYLIANIKTLSDVRIGDTIVLDKDSASEALPGYRPARSMVFCGIYPVQNGEFDNLRTALIRLQLNDSAFTFTPESSDALGFGFRCGFLGLLHMEIVQERLERESGVDIVQTAPNVTYEILTIDGEVLQIHSPSEIPDPTKIEEFREPVVKLDIVTPDTHVGAIMKLGIDRRGRFLKQEYIGPGRVLIGFRIPLSEIIFDFFDKLKSVTRGYATMDYELENFVADDLVKMRILVNGEEVDALSTIAHQSHCEPRGRAILKVLRKEIRRHLFKVALQAAVGGKIVAREDIAPVRKDVTAKCYGGDISRKRKLLEKQKAGKKRLKMVGNVEIPQKAFLAVLSADD